MSRPKQPQPACLSSTYTQASLARCERLFSEAEQLCSKRRHRLEGADFQMQFLLNVNRRIGKLTPFSGRSMATNTEHMLRMVKVEVFCPK